MDATYLVRDQDRREGRWLHSANATVVGLLICKYDVLITVESHDSVREDENEEGDFL